MSRSLPPLNALRAFEAAARHLSVTKAAAELNVTPSAISHHIKALEEYFEVRLFMPSRRRLELSEAGRAFLPDLTDGFDRLFAATELLRASDTQGQLTVGTAGSFAVQWLVPRLSDFNARYPEIDVRVQAAPLLVDATEEALESGDVDVVIRFGPGHYPGHDVQRLMDEVVYPVCSPDIVDKDRPLNRPADLARHVLIHDEGYTHYAREGLRFKTTFPDWRMWAEAAGLDGLDLSHGPRFSTSALAIQAAVDGQGVMMGRSVLVHDELQAGRLIKPFELSVSNVFAYYGISREGDTGRAEIAAFRNWVGQKAGEMEKRWTGVV